MDQRLQWSMSFEFLKSGILPDAVPTSGPFIPRKIWQTCPDKQNVHPKIAACIEQLKQINPNWDYRLFDNKDRREFIKSVSSERFFRAYERLNPKLGVSRSDVFRYLIVFLHGGAYFDLKSGTSRPLDEILCDSDRYILSNWDNGPAGKFPGAGMGKPFDRISGGEWENWFVIAQPGHPYLAAVLTQIMSNIEMYNAFRFGQGALGVLNVTGPHAYTHVIRSMDSVPGTRKIISAQVGVHYTLLSDVKEHQRITKDHYTRVNYSPVTAKGLSGIELILYYFAESMYWPYSRIRTLNQFRQEAWRKSRRSSTAKI